MPNFIKDNTSLRPAKTDRKANTAVPPEQQVAAVDWNEIRQALLDTQSFLRGSAQWVAVTEQASDPAPAGIDTYLFVNTDGELMLRHGGSTFVVGPSEGGGGGELSGDVQELKIGPTANKFGDPDVLPFQTHDYADAGLATHSVIIWKGDDYAASRISGLDATGVNPGDIRIFLNLSYTGIDTGQVTLQHNNSGSAQNNRILCPGCKDFVVPIMGAVILIYQSAANIPDGIPGVTGNRWVVVSSSGWAKQSVMSLLSFYPHMRAAEITGQHDNYEPAGVDDGVNFPLGGGVAGADNTFKEYSVVKVPVGSAGATITGLGAVNGSNNLPADWGSVKIICNVGPGALTFAHQHDDSDAGKQLTLPGGRPFTIKADEAAIFWYPVQDSSGVPDARWRLISANATPLKERIEVTLAAGLTSNYNPGKHDVLEVTGTSPISWIDGLVPIAAANPGLSSNEIRIIKNVGTVPIAVLDANDSASSAANRFRLPEVGPTTGASSSAPPMIIMPGMSVAFQYTEKDGDLYWIPLGAGQVLPTLNTGATITPAALPGSNVDDYAPTDGTSGLSGRWARVWIIQGAVGTNLRGIDATPSGQPPFQYGDRIILTNFGSGLTVKNNDAGSAAANRFTLPSGTDIVLSQFGSLEFMYVGSWIVVGGIPN